jgi:Sulfotransferase family
VSTDEPIFVVGAPRSGTTLLAALLAGHSEIACGPETQFFHKLERADLDAAARDRRWPARATELVSSLTLAGQRVIDLFEIDDAALEADLAARRPAVASMLEALTGTVADRAGKRRWAEKTPNHILHLDSIRSTWPNAPVVRIVRDPRDSAASMRRLPWASDSVVANAHMWSEWHEASRSFFEIDPLSFTLRFEDLVLEPEERLTRLCDFLGERFEPSMLDTRIAGAAISSVAENWKQEVSRPIDRNRGARWKRDLLPDTARCVSLVCFEALGEFGYETLDDPRQTIKTLRLNRTAIEANEADLLRLAKAGIRLQGSDRPVRDDRLGVLATAPGAKRSLEKLAVLFARRVTGKRTTRVDRLARRP